MVGPPTGPAAVLTYDPGVDGGALIKALRTGEALPRPPWVPILGRAAQDLAQLDGTAFTTDAAAHARALLEAAGALSADAVTVGVGTDPAVGLDALRRLTPLLGGRAAAACLGAPDVAAARAYCEAGAAIVFLVAPDRSAPGRFRTLANACRFYEALAILADPDADDPAGEAAALGLDGAVVVEPTGAEPGVVGGGVTAGGPLAPGPPRDRRFFWSFPGEVPAGIPPEDLAALGRRLTA